MDISKKVMLIVDDIEMNRVILNEYFQDEYSILEAENGKEAFQILENQFVDILVTDLYMPIMDGFELITKLRKEGRYAMLPIIAVTEHDEVIENKVLDLGADDFITKPFATKLLCHRVRGVMSEDKTNARIEQFRFCMDFSPIPFGIVKLVRDQDGNANDILYRYVNHSYANILRYSTTELIGSLHYQMLPEFDRSWLAIVEEVEQSGQEKSTTYYSTSYQKYFLLNVYMESSNFCIFTISDVTEQKLAEERLKESEQKYMLALEGASISAWEYDIAEKKIIQTNGSRDTNNYEMTIENVPEIFIQTGYVREDSQKEFLEMYEKIKAGVTHVSGAFWVTNRSKDGWWRKHTTYLVVKDEQGRPTRAYGASMDITENILSEQRYQEEISYHKHAMSSMLATCCLNLTQNVVEEIHFGDTRLQEQDKKFSTDYKKRVGTYMSTIGLSEEENKELGVESLLAQFRSGKEECSKEYWAIWRETGDVVWIHLDVKMLRRPESGEMIAFFYNRDVTKEKILNSIINTTIRFDYDYISCINVWNKHFEIYSGKTNILKPSTYSTNYDNLVNEYIRQAAVGDDIEGVIEAISLPNILHHLEKEEVYVYEYDMQETDGTIRRKMLRYAYADREKGLVINTRTDINDIVKGEKKKQDTLELALENAEQANLAKSDFLARMSHDIRTPMNAIIGVTALAKEQCKDPELNGYLEKIDGSSKFLLGLINDILDISRIESGKLRLNPVEYPLEDFDNDINMTIRPLMEEKKISFSYEMNCGLDCIYTDRVRFNQIFFNLLSNAAKYTPEGGSVTFSAENISKRGTLHWTRFLVRDNGIGMSQKFLEKAFEPFEQELNGADFQWQGTGLGLTIVKKLVEMMSGIVKIESELGKGTTITVDLPLTYAEAGSMSGQEDIQVPAEDLSILNGKRVLLVEDNKINTFVARRLLEGRGIIVEHAENGKDALDMFQLSDPGRYDAILMDIRMPIMNGLEAARAIRQLQKEDAKTIQIIAMTANAYDEDIRKSLQAGMNRHLSKPINPTELYQSLYYCVKEKEAQTRKPIQEK